MSILFILLGSIAFTFLFSTLKTLFQMTEFERPLMSTPPTLPRVPPISSEGSNAVSLPVNNNRAMIRTFPRSLTINKRILVNLNIVECQLVKLKQFLSARDHPCRRKARQRATAKVLVESDSENNQ